MSISLGTAALIAAGGLGVGGIWSGLGGGKKKYNLDDYSADALRSMGLDEADIEAWNSLSESNKRAIIDQHYAVKNNLANLGGILGPDRQVIDNDALLTSLRDLSEIQSAVSSLPEVPDYADSLAYAQDEVDAALEELESLRTMQVNNFNDELSSLASSYNTSRNALLSNQYQQNAQLMDNMTSQLDKQNRNALEAGASAGMRLAGNINTLLSTQNKQSQTSLETANQLAQMMVNQRNAEASVRGRYGDYMSQHFATEQDIKDSLYTRADNYHTSRQNVYDSAIAQWDSKYASNPAWNYRGAFTGSTPTSTSAGTSKTSSNSATSNYTPKTTGLANSAPPSDLEYNYYKQFGKKTPW